MKIYLSNVRRQMKIFLRSSSTAVHTVMWKKIYKKTPLLFPSHFFLPPNKVDFDVFQWLPYNTFLSNKFVIFLFVFFSLQTLCLCLSKISLHLNFPIWSLFWRCCCYVSQNIGEKAKILFSKVAQFCFPHFFLWFLSSFSKKEKMRKGLRSVGHGQKSGIKGTLLFFSIKLQAWSMWKLLSASFQQGWKGKKIV